MSIQTLKLAGRDFVLIPKKEYQRLRDMEREQKHQDAGDVAEAKRRKKESSVPLAEVRKRLGL